MKRIRQAEVFFIMKATANRIRSDERKNQVLWAMRAYSGNPYDDSLHFIFGQSSKIKCRLLWESKGTGVRPADESDDGSPAFVKRREKAAVEPTSRPDARKRIPITQPLPHHPLCGGFCVGTGDGNLV